MVFIWVFLYFHHFPMVFLWVFQCHHFKPDWKGGISAAAEPQVHFFNGGATLQFAAIPLNLLGVGSTVQPVPTRGSLVVNGCEWLIEYAEYMIWVHME